MRVSIQRNNKPVRDRPRRSHLPGFLVAAGLTLVGLHCVLAGLSSLFGIDKTLADKPIVALVTLELAAGGAFLFAVYRTLGGRDETRGALVWIVLVGLAMRVAMMGSTPMLENDFFRYLWDGAVVANGMNPYRFAPNQASDHSESIPPELVRLARDSGDVVKKINYAHLRTIYPPVAQLAFAAAYLLKPWSLLTWRVVLALFDAGTAILLFIALRRLALPRLWLMIYWWNPLVVREVFNAAHMDVVALPIVVGALLMAVKGRQEWAATLLALGTAAKLWPAVLVPIVCAPLRKTPVRLALAIALFALVSVLLFLPVYFGGFDSSSGFVAYGREWEMNDALYMLLWWISATALKILSPDQATVHLAARMLSFAILASCVAVLCRSVRDLSQLWERSLLTIAALFMLSPAQFPWYYLWIVPFLAVRPRFSLIVLAVLVEVYYLRFYFKARGDPGIFDTYIVWLEYAPAWSLFVMEWIRERNLRASHR